MSTSNRETKSRNEKFVKCPETKIWFDKPSLDNPYIAEKSYCFGYDLLELVERRSFVEVLYLLFKGELPSSDQMKLLEALMIGLINPGPRHPATRAAMNAGASKAEIEHILPIALSVIGGEHLGAREVEMSMRFFRKNSRVDPRQIADKMISSCTKPETGDWHPIPGFGTRFNGVDTVSNSIANYLNSLRGAGKMLDWGTSLCEVLEKFGMGWLSPGVAAAVFADLGLNPRAGAGLFQLITAPGLLAHGLEFANKNITAMPFLKDEDYEIEN